MILTRRLPTGAWTPTAVLARMVSPCAQTCVAATVGAANYSRSNQRRRPESGASAPRQRSEKGMHAMRHAVLATALAALVAAPLGARGASGSAISGSYVEARTAEVFTG